MLDDGAHVDLYRRGDIVVIRDHGVAALALARGAKDSRRTEMCNGKDAAEP